MKFKFYWYSTYIWSTTFIIGILFLKLISNRKILNPNTENLENLENFRLQFMQLPENLNMIFEPT